MSVPDHPRKSDELQLAFWKLLVLLAAIVLLSLLVVPAVFTIAAQVTAGGESGPILTTAAAILAQTAIMFGLLYALPVRTWGLSWRQLGARPAERKWIGRAILLGILAVPLVSGVVQVVQSITGEPLDNPQVQMLAPAGFTWFSAVVTVFLASIVAPFVEEFLFRGLVHRWISERTGMWIAIPVSAAIFAVLHGIPLLIPPLFVVGCLLAWVYEKSRSIWPCIVLHGIYNGVMTVSLYVALASGVEF